MYYDWLHDNYQKQTMSFKLIGHHQRTRVVSQLFEVFLGFLIANR